MWALPAYIMVFVCCNECDEILEIENNISSGQICIFCGSIGNFYSTEPIPNHISSSFYKFLSSENLTMERKTKFHSIKHGKISYKRLEKEVATKVNQLMSMEIDRDPPRFMVSDIEFLRGGRKDWEKETGQSIKRRISKSEIESQSWGSLWHWLISVKIRAVADDFIQMNKKIKIYSRDRGELIQSGKPDGIFRDRENSENDYVPIEIKSCSNSAYNLGKIKPSWIKQSERYARIARYMGWVEKPRIMLIIINRENGLWTAGTIDFKDFKPEQILSQSEVNTKIDPELLSRYLNKEKLPAKMIRAYLDEKL
tara:strand:+ start:79 stop:1011 length:933 start_codon:yes stop_codon:yes gene_type:complete